MVLPLGISKSVFVMCHLSFCVAVRDWTSFDSF
jgi:hypothetical protein